MRVFAPGDVAQAAQREHTKAIEQIRSDDGLGQKIRQYSGGSTTDWKEMVQPELFTSVKQHWVNSLNPDSGESSLTSYITGDYAPLVINETVGTENLRESVP